MLFFLMQVGNIEEILILGALLIGVIYSPASACVDVVEATLK